MSAVLQDDERQGPEARRIPPHGSVTIREKTGAEATDAGNKEAEAERQAQPWTPEGFYWGRSRNGDPLLKPTQAYINDIARTAEIAYINGLTKFSDSAEMKAIIKTLGEELRAVYCSRRALNDKSYDRVVKRDCDDAAYQIVQAAKYKLDAEELMRQNQEYGATSKRTQKIEDLRNYGKNSLREGYALTGAIYVACEDEKPPVFNYKASAERAANYSGERITEAMGKRAKNQRDEKKLDAEAEVVDSQDFFKD